MMSVVWNSASVIDGRISDFHPLSVRSPVVHHPIATVSPRPKLGSQPSCTANTRISRMPMRKVGRLTPTSDAASSACARTLSPSQRRVDAGGDPDDQRDQRGGDRQLERGRQALAQQRRHLAALPQRDAEVALRGVLDEAGELDVERPVEPELRAQAHALFRRRVLPQHERDRVAGVVEERERDQRDRAQHGDRLQQPAKDVREHRQERGAGRRQRSNMPEVARRPQRAAFERAARVA